MNAKLRRRLEALEETSCSLLEKIQSGAAPPKGRLPIIVSAYVGTADLRFSTCRRTLCPDGMLMEYVKIQGRQGELASCKGLSDEELDRWIATFPIKLSNLGANKPFGETFR